MGVIILAANVWSSPQKATLPAPSRSPIVKATALKGKTMQLIATRHYHDWHPATREEFELQDRMYRKPDGSFVLMVAGALPEDRAVGQSFSLAGVFEWLRECPEQIERAVIINEIEVCGEKELKRKTP